MAHRIEQDSFGPIEVPAARLWGAQTQRSLHHFHISTEQMAPELVAALAQVKRAAAEVNRSLGKLDDRLADAIVRAADEVLAGQHASEFPLSVWQTGSGTQSNMNMNEVLANRASELLGGERGEGRLLHPNDHVNMGQSSNDMFPTAMHVAAATALVQNVLPALAQLRGTIERKSGEFADIVKIGRTHLQDATPLTLGQEFSGYAAQLDYAGQLLQNVLPGVLLLAAGGTAVGTGLNAHPEFASRIANELAARTGIGFGSAPNKFAALAGNDVAITVGGASGNFELNVFKPMIVHNFLQSARLLADGMRSFDQFCVQGIAPNLERIGELMERSLMLVTALAPHIGYDKAAQIAKKAQHEGLTLKEAALQLGFVTEQQFEQWIVPLAMTRPG